MNEPNDQRSTEAAATSEQARPHAGRDSFGRLVRLSLKELREILRDRRTIVTLVIMPLLVYPLLSLMFQSLLFTSINPSQQMNYIIGVESEQAGERLQRYLFSGEQLLREQRSERREPDGSDDSPGHVGMVPTIGGSPQESFEIVDDVEASLADGSIDLAVRLRGDDATIVSPQLGTRLDCELIYREESVRSNTALQAVQRRLRAVNDEYVRQSLRGLGASAKLPTQSTERAITDTGHAAFSLATLVPLILIMMTITGAVYPAIDLTAGERERGTLEILVAAPVPRLGLLIAKYVAVLTVAMLTATANLLAMTITLVSTGLTSLVFGESESIPFVILQIFGLLFLFAAFFSAVLLAVTSFARSFKEAQAYLIPLMLVSLGPGMLSMIPGIEFSGWLAVTPLINIVLLSRDLFQGTVDPVLAVAAVLSTLLYALAAIGLAARIFGTDAVLYGSPTSWADLFRRPREYRDASSAAGAMSCLALMFPAFFLLANLIARWEDVSMQTRLLMSACVTALLFGGIPLGAAVFYRVRILEGFQLKLAGVVAFLAAGLLGLTLWPLVFELIIVVNGGLQWLQQFAFGDADSSSSWVNEIASVKKMLDQWQSISPLLILITLAVAPAIFEELFFRGYLFRAIRGATSARNTIIVTALLFGIFHVVATSGLAPQRFLPSTVIGLILGWVCWRSGSVLPGMVLHALNNGVLLMLAYYHEQLTLRGLNLEGRSHLPASWLIVATLAVAAGTALMFFKTKSQMPHRLTTPRSVAADPNA